MEPDSDSPIETTGDGSELPTEILWSSPSQDESSGKTGSSVFDFDGDGSGEHNECFEDNNSIAGVFHRSGIG